MPATKSKPKKEISSSAFTKRPSLQAIAFNAVADKAKVRDDTLEGRPHWVVPMVMLTQGVHNGSRGPLLYLEEELEDSPEAWDHKPVVVYHPEDDESACRPSILNSQKVGVILNTRVENGKLKAEAWLDKDRVEEVDNRIADAVVHNRMMELSTGLFTSMEKKPGEWNGEKYKGIARNFKPDHLAILPDKVGACSIKDGAGLVRNEMSFSNISYSLRRAVNERYGYEADVVDVYDGFFIVSRQGKLQKMSYEASEGEIEIDGEPEDVMRVTEYRTKEGEFVGNVSESPLTGETENVNNAENDGASDSNSTGEKPMAKKRTKLEIVNNLIASEQTKWEEKHRKQLLKMDEELLLNMEPVEDDDEPDPKKKLKAPLVDDGNKPGQNKDNEMVGDIPTGDLEDEEAQQMEQDTGRKGSQGKTAGPAKTPKQSADADEPKKGKKGTNNMSAKDFIANNAPPELRSSLMRGMRMEQRERARLIKTITSNKANKFSKEQLEERDTEELEMLAELAAPAAEERESRRPAFAGAGGFVDNEVYDDEEDVLDLPVMNFANTEE